MRKLLVCIWAIIMAFVFVSCQIFSIGTSVSFDLNGKWKGTAEWKSLSSGTYYFQSEITQKGNRITASNTSNQTGDFKDSGTIKGNVIHMESTSHYAKSGTKIFLPAREIHISQDGNTLTTKFRYTWKASYADGVGIMKWTLIRE